MSSTEIIPLSGEVVNLDDADEVAVFYHRLVEAEQQLAHVKRMLKRALLHHQQERGEAGTFDLDGTQVKIVQSDSISWDYTVLGELIVAGLPDERWEKLVTETVTVSKRVNATVARQIAKANPRYAAIIERAQTRTPKEPSVTVTIQT